MRAGRGLGMILDGKKRDSLMLQPFQGLIIQVNVGQFHIRIVHGWDVYGKAVILRGDLHPAGLQIFDRLVGSSVSEFEFKSGSAQGQSNDLMAQAYTKDGQPAQQVLNGSDDSRIGRWIPWAVGKQQAVRLKR